MSQVLCIDGPGGAGKGTVSRQVAERLGFKYLDSGALYRALAVISSEKNIDHESVSELAEIAESLSVEFLHGDVVYQGKDISPLIRNEVTGALASKLATYPEVRQSLLHAQRNFAAPEGLVADGRDMGTTVFPSAQLKIYLSATAEERARRRFIQLRENDQKRQSENDHNADVKSDAKQLIHKEDGDSLRALVDEIRARDERDLSRKASPLRPAEDAIIIDSTSMTIEEVVSEVLRHWSQ